MEKKYTFWQNFHASILNTNAKWLYSTKVEKLLMSFEDLSEEEKKDFLNKMKK